VISNSACRALVTTDGHRLAYVKTKAAGRNGTKETIFNPSWGRIAFTEPGSYRTGSGPGSGSPLGVVDATGSKLNPPYSSA
jgi:hypothetical protein